MEAAGAISRYDAMMQEYCRTRDVALRNELLEHYGYIAEIAAKKFAGRGVEYDDLYQVASLALLRALERYDEERGVKFGSFAMPSVIGEIKNYFRDRSRAIRLPRRASEQMKRLREVQEELTIQLDRPPKPEEIAQTMQVPLEQVYELLEARASTRIFSLDEAAPGNNGEEGMRLGDLIGEEPREYDAIENADFLKRAFAMLTEEERNVILARFVENKSQRAIAQDMGVSQMYISRLERRVLARLREQLVQN